MRYTNFKTIDHTSIYNQKVKRLACAPLIIHINQVEKEKKSGKDVSNIAIYEVQTGSINLKISMNKFDESSTKDADSHKKENDNRYEHRLNKENEDLELTIKDLTVAYTKIQRDIIAETNKLKLELIAAEDTIKSEKARRIELEDMALSFYRTINELNKMANTRIRANEQDLSTLFEIVDKCKNIPDDLKDKTLQGNSESSLYHSCVSDLTTNLIEKDLYQSAKGDPLHQEITGSQNIIPVSFEKCFNDCIDKNLCTSGLYRKVTFVNEDLQDLKESFQEVYEDQVSPYVGSHFQELLQSNCEDTIDEGEDTLNFWNRPQSNWDYYEMPQYANAAFQAKDVEEITTSEKETMQESSNVINEEKGFLGGVVGTIKSVFPKWTR